VRKRSYSRKGTALDSSVSIGSPNGNTVRLAGKHARKILRQDRTDVRTRPVIATAEDGKFRLIDTPAATATLTYKSNHYLTGFDPLQSHEIVDRARGVRPFMMAYTKVSASLAQGLRFWFYPVRYL
jgi:hypothetical protein